MTVLGFAYDEVFNSDEPMKFEFNKEKEQCIAYYTSFYDEAFILIKNEVVLKEEMMVLFIHEGGLIQSFITKIDYDKKRIKVNKTWISEKDKIYGIGIATPMFADEEETEVEEEEI